MFAEEWLDEVGDHGLTSCCLSTSKYKKMVTLGGTTFLTLYSLQTNVKEGHISSLVVGLGTDYRQWFLAQ